eukprot:115469-Ditylum_brightwellii.AAC.1
MSQSSEQQLRYQHIPQERTYRQQWPKRTLQFHSSFGSSHPTASSQCMTTLDVANQNDTMQHD